MKSMLQPMIQLMQEIMHMKFPWNLWMLILGLVNLIGGVYFIDTLEGKLALLSLFGAMLIMTMVYAKKGFVRR